jgi:filamentous hemagglutinin
MNTAREAIKSIVTLMASVCMVIASNAQAGVDQSSSSASAGMSLGGTTGVTLSASGGSGDGNGSDLYYTNTHVQGGKVVNIQSGADTTLAGAIVKADTVNANVGGNLNIQSLQDSSRYKESSQTTGGSITVGPKPGGSLSAGATHINSNYQSVAEQSGIRAGDGGFNVNVSGNTTLVGGAITSTDKAVQDGKNTFTTAKLDTRDIQNTASYNAESYQVTVGSNGGSVGAGQDSGSTASTTSAAISGIAGNKAARTGDAETGIQKIFDQSAVSKEVNAQVAITNEFGKQAPRAVADYAQSKAKELEKTDPEEAKKWMEGGIYRVALHTALGAMGGGVQGAVGAGTLASAAPLMNEMQDKFTASLQQAGLSSEAAQAISKTLAQTTALAAGAAVGGVQGGAMALNVDANNRQLHPDEMQRIKELAKTKAQQVCRGDTSCERHANLYWTDMLERAAESRVDTQEAIKNQAYYQQIIAAAGRPGSEASFGAAENFFQQLGEAQRMLDADAGKPMLDARGNPIRGTDGKPQTYFSATQAQRDNPYGNIFPGGSPNTQASVIPGKERRDQERLERLSATSGQAIPDTTIEETLFGMRMPIKGTGTVVRVSERNAGSALVGTTKAAEEALMRSGGAFDKAGNPLLDMSALTSEQKRVIGEQLFGPNTVKQIVPDGQQLARMQGQGSNGLDELYKVSRKDVDYVNIEYKFVGQDSKTGSQVLKNTADGKQGSESWMGGSNRIRNAVGTDQAFEVAAALRAGRVESWVVTVRPDGSTFVEVLDALGKPKPIGTSKIILPNVNLSGAQP